MQPETASWLASAEDDGAAAQVLVEHGFYAHAVFYTHLWVEKTLKAFIAEHAPPEMPYNTHNLLSPLRVFPANEEAASARTIGFLAKLSRYSVASRYTLGEEAKLIYTLALSRKMLEGAQEVTPWLRQRMNLWT